MSDSDLIDKLGGSSVLAKRLGYPPGGVQRVQNWKRRGIPPRVKLEWPDLFLRPAVRTVDDAEAQALAEQAEHAG